MPLDSNGIWQYTESETAAPVSTMLNRLAASVSALIVPIAATLPAAKHEVAATQQMTASMAALASPVQVSLSLPRPARVLIILSGQFGEGGGLASDAGALAVELSGAITRAPIATNRSLNGNNVTTRYGASFVEYVDSPAGALTAKVFGQGNDVAVRGVAVSMAVLNWTA